MLCIVRPVLLRGCRGGVTGLLLRVVVSFSLGSAFEAIECIQVYYTALYRPHGSTDMTSKTMHKITLCHDAALHVSCQSFSLLRPYSGICCLLYTLELSYLFLIL